MLSGSLGLPRVSSAARLSTVRTRSQESQGPVHLSGARNPALARQADRHVHLIDTPSWVVLEFHVLENCQSRGSRTVAVGSTCLENWLQWRLGFMSTFSTTTLFPFSLVFRRAKPFVR